MLENTLATMLKLGELASVFLDSAFSLALFVVVALAVYGLIKALK